jgi:hypothetical protein
MRQPECRGINFKVRSRTHPTIIPYWHIESMRFIWRFGVRRSGWSGESPGQEALSFGRARRTRLQRNGARMRLAACKFSHRICSSPIGAGALHLEFDIRL